MLQPHAFAEKTDAERKNSNDTDSNAIRVLWYCTDRRTYAAHRKVGAAEERVAVCTVVAVLCCECLLSTHFLVAFLFVREETCWLFFQGCRP